MSSMSYSTSPSSSAFVNVHSHNDITDSSSDDEFSDCSVASDAYDYEEFYGRKYHNFSGANYLLPNDQDEEIRLKFAHDIWKDHLGGKHFVTVLKKEQLTKFMDMGAGFGHWTLDVADSYQSAKIIGMDLSPVQPGFVQKNVEFLVGDLERPWLYKPRTFGFIHGRGLAGSIGDWPSLLKRTFRHLQPGGALELQERDLTQPVSLDSTYTPDTALHKYFTLLDTAGRAAGRPFAIISDLKQWALNAGYEDVQEIKGFLPVKVGPGMTEVEKYTTFVVLEAFEAYGLKHFVEVMGVEYESARKIIDDAANELKSGAVKIGFRTMVVTGRKPMNAPAEDDFTSDDEELEDDDGHELNHHHHHHSGSELEDSEEEEDEEEYTTDDYTDDSDSDSEDPTDSEEERDPNPEQVGKPGPSTTTPPTSTPNPPPEPIKAPSTTSITPEPYPTLMKQPIDFDATIDVDWDATVDPNDTDDDDDTPFDATNIIGPYKRARDKAADAVARAQLRQDAQRREARKNRKRSRKGKGKGREGEGGVIKGNDSGFMVERCEEEKDRPGVLVRETPPGGEKAV